MNKTPATSQLRLALYEPRIPQNTGNIARTCAAFQISLDLIEPLGFTINDKYLKRAGLDYWKYLDQTIHSSFNTFKETVNQSRLIGFSKNGTYNLQDISFLGNDILLFGREDIGLPSNVRNICDLMVKIPMPGIADENGSNGVRSLNLSVACGIAAYAAINH